MKRRYAKFATHLEWKNVDLQLIIFKGNGFAERNIQTIRDMLRAVLLQRKMKQSEWRKLLPRLVFALNTSESKAIKCIPYNVVFDGSAILPQDILFNHHENAHLNDVTTAAEYSEDTSFALQDIYDQVLQICS